MSCHGPDRVGFVAPGAWSLILDPNRTCEGAAWLYPDDRLVVRWPDGPDPTHVRIAAHAYRPRARVTYVVRQGGDVVERGRLGNHGEVTEVAVGPGPRPTLVLRGTHYALVVRAELVAR